MINNMFMPLVPVSVAHLVEVLSNHGCCVVAGRAGIYIILLTIYILNDACVYMYRRVEEAWVVGSNRVTILPGSGRYDVPAGTDCVYCMLCIPVIVCTVYICSDYTYCMLYMQ